MHRLTLFFAATLALGCSFEIDPPPPLPDGGPPELACARDDSCYLTGLALGQRHTCVLSDFEVVCFGANSEGQSRPGFSDDVVPSGPVGQRAMDIGAPGTLTAGLAHTCGVYSGFPLCWGSAEVVGGSPSPRVISSAGGAWSGIHAGVEHQCWLEDPPQDAERFERTLRCSGAWDGLHLGVPAPEPVAIPLPQTAQDLSATSVIAGGFQTCVDMVGVIDEELVSETFCWGGVPPDGPLQDGAWRREPHRLALEDGYVAALGTTHGCALSRDADAVRCWGQNRHGQLGVPRDDPRAEHVVTVPFDFDGVRQVCTGGEVTLDDGVVRHGTAHTCAVDNLGVVCWGANDRGQSGTAPSEALVAPQRVPGTAGVMNLACGGAHTCIVDFEHHLYCWGANDQGQQGSPPSGPMAIHRVDVR